MSANREYHRQYYLKNAERIKAKNKAYNKANAEKRKEYYKTYSKVNAEKIKAISKEYYRKNPIRELKVKIKTEYGCLNPGCKWVGRLPSCCLEFHHLENKAFNIGSCKMSKAMLPVIIAEINKCTVLCAVCHAMETHGLLDASSFDKCTVDTNGNILG